MTVVCVRADSLVPILAPLQFNSAEFSDKEEIIAPVITVWERFSVAKNQQMSKHPWSLQPVSCSSSALNWEPCGQLIKGFHTCDYTIYVWVFRGHAEGNLFCKEAQSLSLFPSPSLLSVSFTSSPLSVSPPWGKEATKSITAWFV